MAVQTSKGRSEPAPPPMPSTNGIAETPPAQLTTAEVRQLIALMESSDLVEITIDRPASGWRISLRKTFEVIAGESPTASSALAPAPVLASAPTIIPAAPTAPPELLHVTAPMVGLWFPAMRTGQKALVAVGDIIREGQVVGAIETLHLMNEVESQVNGRVREILVKPGQAVEYGQPLITLDPVSDDVVA